MWKRLFRMVLLMVAVSSLTVGVSSGAEQGKLSAKSVALRESLRDLWGDHVFWERTAALATSLGEVAAVDVADQRVVLNARALADSLTPYYGDETADKMFSFLAIHYTAVKEYLTATHSNNEAGKEAASQRLMKNAADIAAFMGVTNRNWPKEVLAPLFTAHAGHHMAQINNFHARNYNAEAQVYVEMKRHVYHIADAMAAGIVKQFPKKF